MKFKFSLIIGLHSVLSFAQTTTKPEIDLSKIYVEYVNNEIKKNSDAVVFLVDGKKYPASIIRTIKPEAIKNINVIKSSALYPEGAVEIETEKQAKINLLSLKDLIKQQTNHQSDDNIYFIDNELIEFKASEYFVDQNNIFRIVIKPIQTADVNYNLIKIYTKTDKNISDFTNPKIVIR